MTAVTSAEICGYGSNAGSGITGAAAYEVHEYGVDAFLGQHLFIEADTGTTCSTASSAPPSAGCCSPRGPAPGCR